MPLPKLNGNILTVPVNGMTAVGDLYTMLHLEQFSVKVLDSHLELSFPVTKAVETNIPGILHGARVRAREEEKPELKPPTGGGNPDGTPPSGGTPGTPVLDTYTYTEARAA